VRVKDHFSEEIPGPALDLGSRGNKKKKKRNQMRGENHLQKRGGKKPRQRSNCKHAKKTLTGWTLQLVKKKKGFYRA